MLPCVKGFTLSGEVDDWGRAGNVRKMGLHCPASQRFWHGREMQQIRVADTGNPEARSWPDCSPMHMAVYRKGYVMLKQTAIAWAVGALMAITGSAALAQSWRAPITPAKPGDRPGGGGIRADNPQDLPRVGTYIRGIGVVGAAVPTSGGSGLRGGGSTGGGGSSGANLDPDGNKPWD